MKWVKAMLNFVNVVTSHPFVLAVLAIVMTIANIITIWGKIQQWIPRKIRTAAGSLWLLTKDRTATALNGLFSAVFYAGGLLPDSVRKELLEVTNPTHWWVVENPDKPEGPKPGAKPAGPTAPSPTDKLLAQVLSELATLKAEIAKPKKVRKHIGLGERYRTVKVRRRK